MKAHGKAPYISKLLLLRTQERIKCILRKRSWLVLHGCERPKYYCKHGKSLNFVRSCFLNRKIKWIHYTVLTMLSYIGNIIIIILLHFLLQSEFINLSTSVTVIFSLQTYLIGQYKVVFIFENYLPVF